MMVCSFHCGSARFRTARGTMKPQPVLDAAPSSPAQDDPHANHTSSRLNWLRAAVLGANDGIVSVAGLVMGVAAATDSRAVIFTAGLAGLISGALSMAAGEYVSVSSQRDTEQALLEKERVELATSPDEELAELASLYEARGLSASTARLVAEELSLHDALEAHVEVELGFDPDELTNPWQAALASAAAFTVGAIIPLVAVLLPAAAARAPLTFVAVLVALAITGALSALAGGANVVRATARVVVGGALAMAITYAIGRLFGVSGS